jgi:site-specific DNA-methyltransferase (adenine-specific)
VSEGVDSYSALDNMRNKRDVWTVSTEPLTIAHFATFPQKLILPCVLSGCPENGIVLDPFMGSGTTALVAMKNLRKFIGCELNPEYVKIAEQRIKNERGLFDDV